MARRGILANARGDKEAPFLMNMSDDPSLSGCLVYYLKKGVNNFGSQKDSEVMLNGLGIRK